MMCILKCQVKSIIIGIVHEHLQVCQRVIHDLGCARTPLDQRQMVLSQKSAHDKQIKIKTAPPRHKSCGLRSFHGWLVSRFVRPGNHYLNERNMITLRFSFCSQDNLDRPHQALCLLIMHHPLSTIHYPLITIHYPEWSWWITSITWQSSTMH